MRKKKMFVLGRFQPLHHGHLKTYRVYKEQGFDVEFLPYVIEGYFDENYPFSEDEIKKYFDESKVNYKIVKIRKSIFLFVELLLNIAKYVKNYKNDSEIYFLVPKSRKLLQSLFLFPLTNGSKNIIVSENSLNLHGKHIREMYYNHDKTWTKLVPMYVRKVLLERRKDILQRVNRGQGYEFYDLKIPHFDIFGKVKNIVAYIEKYLFSSI